MSWHKKIPLFGENMKVYIIILIFGIYVSILASNCGVRQEDYDKLKAENERLQTELDECKYGADKISAAVENAYKENNFSLARQNIPLLYERHPESPKNAEFKKLLKEIEKKELEDQNRKATAEKERIRLANLNNTGMWSIGHYIDDFGEPTKKAYIINTIPISGLFSNTATQNSELTVQILITNSSDIAIQLYEYAGNNPVKAYSSEDYTILIQDKKGERYKMNAINYSDRLCFDKSDSRKIHNIFMKGGKIKFRIIENDTQTTHYEFDIKNADWYDNAYKKLKES